MKKNIILLSLLTMMAFSCGQKKSSQDSIAISGITARNIDASPFGNIDPDDWVNDAEWPDFILAKFNFSDTFNYSLESHTSTLQSIMCYPNPLNTYCTLSIQSSNQTIMKYILVDETTKVYRNGTTKLKVGSNSINFQLNDSEFARNKYYRFYYAFYGQDKTIYYKGHGDIKRN